MEALTAVIGICAAGLLIYYVYILMREDEYVMQEKEAKKQ